VSARCARVRSSSPEGSSSDWCSCRSFTGFDSRFAEPVRLASHVFIQLGVAVIFGWVAVVFAQDHDALHLALAVLFGLGAAVLVALQASWSGRISASRPTSRAHVGPAGIGRRFLLETDLIRLRMELHQQPPLQMLVVGLTLLNRAEPRLLPAGDSTIVRDVRIDRHAEHAAPIEQVARERASRDGADAAPPSGWNQEHVESAHFSCLAEPGLEIADGLAVSLDHVGIDVGALEPRAHLLARVGLAVPVVGNVGIGVPADEHLHVAGAR
jgi:hypothetical protein